MSTHNLCLSRNMKNIRGFLSENFHFFLVVKFSVYLNRRVFVMPILVMPLRLTSTTI